MSHYHSSELKSSCKCCASHSPPLSFIVKQNPDLCVLHVRSGLTPCYQAGFVLCIQSAVDTALVNNLQTNETWQTVVNKVKILTEVIRISRRGQMCIVSKIKKIPMH
jgi:hypothetical protein